MTRALLTQALDLVIKHGGAKLADGTYIDSGCEFTLLATALRAHLAQPEQEPVAVAKVQWGESMWIHWFADPLLLKPGTKLYTAPPVPAGMVMVPVEPTPEMRLIS